MRLGGIGLVVAILVAGACGVSDDGQSSSGQAVDDPLGVIDRLGSLRSDDVVVWEMCSRNEVSVGMFERNGGVGFVERSVRYGAGQGDELSVATDQVVVDGVGVFERGGFDPGYPNWDVDAWRRPIDPVVGDTTVLTSLTAVGSLLARFQPDDTDIASAETADGFLRFESSANIGERTSVAHRFGVSVGSDWVLDVWADDDGSVERIRTMNLRGDWRELRFVDADGVPQTDFGTCPDSPRSPAKGWMGKSGWEPDSAVPLIVSTDANGRPYDVAISDEDGHEVRLLTRFVVPDGELRIADGIALGVTSGRLDSDEVVEVDFPAGDDSVVELDVRVIRETGRFSGVLGVRLEVPDSTVDRWDDWESAYGTNGGLGGVTTQRLIDEAHVNDWDESTQPFAFDDDWDDEYWLEDLDGVPGNDFLVFSNGFGDGGFPMARGFDRAGLLVAVVIWDNRYPWRLAVPDGEVPASVRLREAQLIRCMEEPALVELDGSCPTSL